MGWRRGTVSGHESLEGQGSPEGQGSLTPGPRRPSWKACPAAPAGPLGRAEIPPGASLPAAQPPARAYRWSLPCPSAKNHIFQSHPPTGSSQAEVEGRGFLPCPLCLDAPPAGAPDRPSLHGRSCHGSFQGAAARGLWRQPPLPPPHPRPLCSVASCYLLTSG